MKITTRAHRDLIAKICQRSPITFNDNQVNELSDFEFS